MSQHTAPAPTSWPLGPKGEGGKHDAASAGSIARYIRVIGRGKEGARSLDAAQAHDLMSQVLDGRISDLEIGAFALAMRIKGESVAELSGFLRAVHERCLALPDPPARSLFEHVYAAPHPRIDEQRDRYQQYLDGFA